MAQPSVKAWSATAPTGAWADDVAHEEAQTGAPLVAPVNEAAFPSLDQAMKAAPPGKAKKGKGVKMSLQDFTSGSAVPFRSQGPPKMTDEQIRLLLPTGSRGKVEGEDDPNALGGGFKDYGGNRGERGDRGDRGGWVARGNLLHLMEKTSAAPACWLPA